MTPAIYKGYEYYADADGVWTVRSPDGALFIVGLDDSKASGARKFHEGANNAKACRDYIDWVIA